MVHDEHTADFNELNSLITRDANRLGAGQALGGGSGAAIDEEGEGKESLH